MDADRRRKTVIAGTFAIGRKSASNSRPISAGEMQRTKAEMTMASMHVPTLHKARAKGISRALLQRLSHWLRERPAAEHIAARMRGMGRRWALFRKARPERGQGKIRSSATALVIAPHAFFSNLPDPDFVSARNILRPEIFQPRVTQ
jgi:hypothetical protein